MFSCREALTTSALLVIASVVGAQPPAKPELPKVVLVGDSIRLGYAPKVAKRLEGKAIVASVAANGGDSANVLKHLDEWVAREKPAVVHINCGLHDLKLDRKTKRHQVGLDDYEANLRRIVERVRQTTAAVVFANTTPILDERHAKRKASFDRLEADVLRYNAVAAKVMRSLGTPVHDLHWVVEQGNAAQLLGPDGTHYTPAGYDRLAEAVADCVMRQLTITRPKPLSAAPGGSEAAAAYRKTEAERDAQVPAAYKNLTVGQFVVPESASAWKAQRPEVLQKVVRSLGDLPPRPSPSRVRTISRELRSGYVVERIALDNGVDGEVAALLLLPETKQPAPAILWLHSSTPDKSQILTPNANGGAEPLGETFVRAGYAVLAPDAYWHGDRVGSGPSGAAETDRAEQESLFKLHLWMGRTLWGMFVRDDQVALDYLCSRPEVDKSRIGATGMSMGSTRAWWLAAVDERVAATVGVACLTRYQNLIAHGQLRQHGVYYFVDGLLKHFDVEAVVALIAPRPYLALTGELDAGSPADGIRAIERSVSQVYGKLNAADRFQSVLYPEVGHTYTPDMRERMLVWFDRWLKPEKSNVRRPADEAEMRFWLDNMVSHHRFTVEEVTHATGLAASEIAEALRKFDLAPGKSPSPTSNGVLRVMPYPGGRHPRIGFLEGASRPQRETKVSVFTPWDPASYVVVDVPEAIWSNLGLTYLAHTHVPTIWSKQGLELEPMEWTRRPDGALDVTRSLPNGIAFGAKVVPGKDGVRMELWLTNGTKAALTDLRVQNCVMLKGAVGFESQTNVNKVFSGPFVACRSADGRRWIITAWKPTHRGWANSKCPCLHSDPKFPDCAPGDTQRLRGWLSFYEGTEIESEFARLEKLAF